MTGQVNACRTMWQMQTPYEAPRDGISQMVLCLVVSPFLLSCLNRQGVLPLVFLSIVELGQVTWHGSGRHHGAVCA